jgi:hypothetical protein
MRRESPRQEELQLSSSHPGHIDSLTHRTHSPIHHPPTHPPSHHHAHTPELGIVTFNVLGAFRTFSTTRSPTRTGARAVLRSARSPPPPRAYLSSCFSSVFLCLATVRCGCACELAHCGRLCHRTHAPTLEELPSAKAGSRALNRCGKERGEEPCTAMGG